MFNPTKLTCLALFLCVASCSTSTKNVSNKKQSSDVLLIYLVSAVNKMMTEHVKDITNLENKLQKQQEIHSEEVRKLQEIHTKDVTNFENKLKKQQEIHSQDVTKLQETHAKDVTILENKQQRQQEIHADELKKQSEETKKQIDKKYQIEIKQIKQEMSNKQPITPVIGFHVALAHKFASGGSKIPFDKVVSNYGNGWNSITHTFTVPVNGVYFISLTIMDGGTPQAYSYLMRGTKSLQLVHTSRGAAYDMSTTSTVLSLNAGEHIYARHQGGTVISSNNYLYTHLVGFLIQKIN